jgi:hypothetical protein
MTAYGTHGTHGTNGNQTRGQSLTPLFLMTDVGSLFRVFCVLIRCSAPLAIHYRFQGK